MTHASSWAHVSTTWGTSLGLLGGLAYREKASGRGGSRCQEHSWVPESRAVQSQLCDCDHNDLTFSEPVCSPITAARRVSSLNVVRSN